MTLSPGQEGTFTVTFTVTDSLGRLSTPVTRVVTVTPPANQPMEVTLSETEWVEEAL